ncbi:MAG: hypothetical protein II193_10070 [Lachnospiraceae bacterium]|nr:hypothetical protein [Lachnospiraceae bacterium]
MLADICVRAMGMAVCKTVLNKIIANSCVMGVYMNNTVYEKGIKNMAGMIRKRDIALVETCDGIAKEEIGRLFSRNGISYLIKTNKIREVRRGRFMTQNKYSFIINRFQEDEAREVLENKYMLQNELAYMVN